MKILAIDQARRGGWSIFDYDSKELLDYGFFAFENKKYDFSKAVIEIKKIIIEIYERNDIDALFIEDIQLQQNVKAFKMLAWLQGVLINLAEEKGWRYGIVTPSQWQGYCNARGRSTKEIKGGIQEVSIDGKKKSKMLSIQFVKDNFGVETTNDNLSDSICIGYYAVNNIELK